MFWIRITFGVFCFLVVSICLAFSYVDIQVKLEKEINVKERFTLNPNSHEIAEYPSIASTDENICNDNSTCKNGGSCLQRSCLCLPGTSGPFCETIDECENKLQPLCDKRNDDTWCQYDIETQRAFCYCRIIEAKFDPSTATCKVCECNLWYRKDYTAWYDCQWGHKGEKICSCREGHAYDPSQEICDDCVCGDHTKWCEFNKFGDKICTCEDGYKLRSNGECEECDCGKHGLCNFDAWSAYSDHDCICDPGYSQLNNTCVECDCGKHGECKFDLSGNKTCRCNERYSERNGKCEFCFCGDHSSCLFQGNYKVCNCPRGYEEDHGFCVDTDECRHNPCGSSRNCINTPGSYVCQCKEGYQPRVEITLLEVCEDINECLDSKSCPDENTECVNTPGSYKCVCKTGFASRGDAGPAVFCENSYDGTIYDVMGIAMVAVIVVSVAVVYLAKRNIDKLRRPIPHHELK